MTNYGKLILILMALLIGSYIVTLFTLVSVASDFKEFQQETVAEIESIKYDIEMLEYRVHKLEHPAYEDILKGDIDNG